MSTLSTNAEAFLFELKQLLDKYDSEIFVNDNHEIVIELEKSKAKDLATLDDSEKLRIKYISDTSIVWADLI